MRVFLDTSSLFKKYVTENGSEALDQLLDEVSEIAVSPTTWIEICSVLARRLREKSLTSKQADWLKTQAERDFLGFHKVIWNESLEEKAVELIEYYSVLTLDAIQLAAGVLSKADVFVTSDKKLFSEASRLIRKAKFV